jgi:hypothetical protein
MDIVRLHIPYEFVRDRTRVSWRDVQFGLVNELLDPNAPIAIAIDRASELEEPSGALLELAAAGEHERVVEMVERLVGSEEECSQEEIRRKWLYLTLAWIYEHRHEYSDPLQRVEEVYADFGYPERVATFVRYMPMVGPDLGSREANEGRLLDRWREYLGSPHK